MPIPVPEELKDPARKPAKEPDGSADPKGLGKTGELVLRKYHDSIPMDALFREGAAGAAGSGRARTAAKAEPAPTAAMAKAPGTEERRVALPPPRVDRELTERSGRAASGWWALLVALLAVAGAGYLLWSGGLLSVSLTDALGLPGRSRAGGAPWRWAAAGGCGALALLALGGLARGRDGNAWVLSLFGRYRGSVRRTGLVWISPLRRRRRVDVRLRHWRSEPMTAVDAQGVELRIVVLVVWRVKDTARALLAVDDFSTYLREQVEAVTARVVSRLPADSFEEPASDVRTLRDAEAVGESLSRTLAAECRAVGVEVFSARPTRLEYAPEVAAAMQRRQIAAIDAKHRDTVLTSVLDAVDDTVTRLTERGLVSLDDYERKALVKDLTVAFYTARGTAVDTH